MAGRARRLLHGLRELWVALGITLAVLVVVEGAAHLVLMFRSGRAGEAGMRPDSYPAEPWVKELRAETGLSSRMRWEPFAYWRRRPFAGKHINVDERGLRRTWSPAKHPGSPSRPRIFFLGASEVWGSGVRDDHTLPSELARYLDAAGFPADVVNYGESGYVSTQSVVTLLRELQRGVVPDVVVYYGGGSDAMSASHNGSAGLPLSESRRSREFNILRDPGRLVPETVRVLASRSALVRLMGVSLDAPRSPPPPPVAPAQLVDLTLQAFDANVAAIDGLAGSYGFHTSYFWQPCLLTKPHRTRFEEKRAARAAGSFPYVMELYARVRRDWRARDPKHFTDLGDFFAETREPRYLDYTHLGETGNREIAAAIGRQLIDRGGLTPRATPLP
jgi:lysophospholipase L1-like esterase